MSFRAVLLGLLLGLFVASATYFNDQVIRQSMLVGHHLPPVVFGLVAILMLTVHPLLSRRGGGVGVGGAGGFRPGEVAVAAAIALAACGWPGNSFYRCFAAVVSLPAHWGKTQTNWLASDVFSFVPGGSGRFAPEHLPDPLALARTLREASDAPQTPAGRIWQAMDPPGRQVVEELAVASVTSFDDQRGLAAALNHVLADPALHAPEVFAQVDLPADLQAQLAAGRAGQLSAFDQVRANRRLLAITFPAWAMPPPRGEGLLLEGGRPDTPTLNLLVSGAGPGQSRGLRDLPWDRWWPTLQLYGGVALLLGLAALCLALVVHPQWSRHELLPYPIARLVEELAHTEPGCRMPAVARNYGFWIALAGVASIHLVNGLSAYFPKVPQIDLSLSFSPLRDLFPNASRVFGSNAYFEPRIYPSVVAFTLFLATQVSFSLGIAQLLFIVLGSVLIAQGIPFERDYLGGSKVNLMAFGSFLAMACMIVFVGRRYYANVIGSMVGMRRHPTTPAFARWAGWGFLLASLGAVVVLHRGGVPSLLGVALVATIMLLWLVMSRISAEAGLFLIKPAWLPVGLLTAMLGFEAIGPAAYIALALATVVLVGESREAIMPFLTNGLRLADQVGPKGPARVAPWMAGMVIVSLLVAGAVSLLMQHNLGLNHSDRFATVSQPMRAFNELASLITEARAQSAFEDAVQTPASDRWRLIQSHQGAGLWIGLGFALVLGTAAARLRLPWWPLHPVAFLVWGTYPMFVFSFSLLLGWLIKAALVTTGGARAYHAALPIAVGVILADVLSALGWSVVGAIYFLATDTSPPQYVIFPG